MNNNYTTHLKLKRETAKWKDKLGKIISNSVKKWQKGKNWLTSNKYESYNHNIKENKRMMKTEEKYSLEYNG